MPNGFTLNDTTFSGDASAGFFVKQITQAQVVNSGLVYVKDNIDKKHTIKRLSVGEDLFQDYKLTPQSADANGGVTIDGRVLQPAEWMIYDRFDPNQFRDTWEAVQLNNTLLDVKLPATVESVIVQEYLKQAAVGIDALFFNGDTATAGQLKFVDGIMKKALADATVIDVPTPVALTSGNIFAKLKETMDLVPLSIRYKPSLKIAMNNKTYQIYSEAQKNQANKGVDVTQGGVKMYDGVPIQVLYAMPDDTIMITCMSSGMDSNLWVGMNSRDNQNYIKIGRVANDSEEYFIKARMSMDVNFGFGEEMVLYTV